MSRGVLRLVRRVLPLAFALVFFDSCIFKDEVEHQINRTVLVYMCAENNLAMTAQSNIRSMSTGLGRGMDNYNLLAYIDCSGMDPALIRIHDFKIDTIAKYPERDSTDPKVMREVIDYVLANFQAEHYGLVMWSHGTGWLPGNKLHYVAPSMGYAPQRRAFAMEGQKPNYSYMDLDEMVQAIPDGIFDYILFDACFMGSVEVAYALRNKAQHIVSSSCEIVSYGFPYHVVTRDLVSNNLLKSCDDFYDYYNSMKGWYRTAGISLVKTDEMDSLARCFRKIIGEYGDTVTKLDMSKIQCFDRFDHHMIFDLEDVVVKLGTRRELMNEFRLQLDKCIPFKKSTEVFFRTDNDSIIVNSYCGLSVYIPLPIYEAAGVNDSYRQTDWSDYTDYK